ncbi:MAG: glycosyltransferase family 2 protein [Paracoccaceae bacterium]
MLNLHFVADTRDVEPFHVSLRRDEKLVVVNRRDRQGWRREIRFPFFFSGIRAPVEVRFGLFGVRLCVDGVWFDGFDPLPRPNAEGRAGLRRGFRHLSRIRAVAIEGAVRRGSLRTYVPHFRRAAASGVTLSDRLELVMADPPAGAAFGAMAGTERIPAVRRSLVATDRKGRCHSEIAAVIPGRIWQNAAEAVVLSLHAADGNSLGSVRLSRSDLRDRIAALALSGHLAQDDRAALQAIEHAHHAVLAPLLPPEALAALLAAAARFRLEGYVLRDHPAPAPVSPPDMLERQVAAFTDHARDAGPWEALSALSLGPASPPDLVLRLCDWFVQCDDVALLSWFAAEKGVALPRPDDPTLDAAALSRLAPLLYARGDFAGVAAAIWAMLRAQGWYARAAFGRVLRDLVRFAPAADGVPPGAEHRQWAIDAALSVLEQRADYWDERGHRDVLDAAAEIVRQGDSLAPTHQGSAVVRTLRLYALDPAFWEALGPDRPSAVEPVFSAFEALRTASLSGMAPPAAALDVLRDLKVVDLPQFETDLSLPLGPDPAPADAMRHLARPLADPSPPSALLAAAARGVAEAMPEAAAGPFAPREGAAVRRALDLLNGPDPATARQLCHDIAALGGARAGFLGWALGQGLVAGLCHQEREAEAEDFVALLERMARARFEPWERDALERAAAPAMGAHAILCGASGHPLGRRVLSAMESLIEVSPHDPVENLATDLSCDANPIFDTLVCVYSCRTHLDDRVAAMRRGWLSTLRGLGVPFLVFTGGGDGTRTGDVVALDAPDDYEGLPAKTLAMVDWVYRHTSFAHLVKIDDDCFMDASRFFGGLNHRKADYYGRPLRRARGEMDRTWHQAKSSTPRGRDELDKSPEPSTYADGGSGYALSRRAMAAIRSAARNPEGQDLLAVSFMEDKLVGDLLALHGIEAQGEGYLTSMFRKVEGSDQPLSRWVTGFLPFRGADIRQVHLDTPSLQDTALACRDATVLRPSRIWPSFAPARLGWNAQALDLVSDPAKLAQVAAQPLVVVGVFRNEAALLPAFFDHYRRLGVTGFLVVDNASTDRTLAALLAQPDVAVFQTDSAYRDAHYGVAWQQALLSHYRVGRWTLVADADELLIWSPGEGGPLAAHLALLDAEGADAARIFMLDLYPDGPLSTAQLAGCDPFKATPYLDEPPLLPLREHRGPFGDSETWTSAVRHRQMPGSRPDLFVAQKIALLKYRPWMRLSAGLHYVARARLARRSLMFGHFKFHAGFHAKAAEEAARGQHFNEAEEYRKYLGLTVHDRAVWHDASVSVRWDQNPTVRRIRDGGVPR